MAYKIGYKQPPKERQFKKGKSGNSKGRPKGSKNFLTMLEKELGQSIVVNENGKKKTISRLEAMVKRIVAGALQGDPKALITLVDILRRTGQFAQAEPAALLPDDYESILDAYVAQRHKANAAKPAESSAKED